MDPSKKIVIIGAGVSGLVAAYELEQAGYSPTILEATEQAGGRLKTDRLEGFTLDHGFQVLLTAYPEAQKYLDYDQLDLQMFDPGAMIFQGRKSYRIADPLREPVALFNMALSPVGSVSDKMKMFFLTRELKKKGLEEIFGEKSQRTMDYLRAKGFSSAIIERFFQPFFGGIFLENELKTSSRMFEFVFKMFGEGHAALPSGGITAIPLQLLAKLNTTTLQYNAQVTEVSDKQVVLSDGKVVAYDQLIVATNPQHILTGFKGQFNEYESVTNLYFSTPEQHLSGRLIALVPDSGYRINNFCVISDTAPSYSPDGMQLLSVSVNGTHQENIEEGIKKELHQLAGYGPETLRHLKTYSIRKALPVIDDLAYRMPSSAVKAQEGIYLAGDHLLNASLNAAMISGRTAAEAVIADA